MLLRFHNSERTECEEIINCISNLATSPVAHMAASYVVEAEVMKRSIFLRMKCSLAVAKEALESFVLTQRLPVERIAHHLNTRIKPACVCIYSI